MKWLPGVFRDRLLDLVDKAKGVKARKRSRAECVGRDHGEKDAERLIRHGNAHRIWDCRRQKEVILYHRPDADLVAVTQVGDPLLF
jgi:hypothetical protein